VTCQDALGLMSFGLDREVEVADMLRLLRHVEQCAACREAQASEAWLSSLLAAGALAEAPPDSLRQRILDRVAREASETARLETWRRRGRFIPALVATALGLLALLALLIHLEARRPAAFRDAVAEHRRYTDAAVPSLEITAGDTRKLEDWIEGRLGLAVRLPSSAGRGEAPFGARIATVDGRAAAHVVYAGGARLISLFVSERPTRRLPEDTEHIIDGVEVYTTTLNTENLGWWEEGDHLFLAVSREGNGDVLALATLCVRSGPTRPAKSRAPDAKGLINPWGLAFNPFGPVWIADNGTGVATL
jgi:anti-sigma factor RsiW